MGTHLSNNDSPLVTIVCYSYNHEKYIRQAIESFVNQETNFKFKIVIHDDASTDGTQKIIKDLQREYPNLVYPILQETNQISQKKNITADFIIPFIEGKYVATCEGDDYWTDNKKIQKQVDVLEKNPTCLFSVHQTIEVSEDGIPNSFVYPSVNIQEGIIKSKDFVNMCLKQYLFHTSSFFFNASKWIELQSIWAALGFAASSPVGDIPTELFFGTSGDVYYLRKSMSCYRRGNKQSYTYNQFAGDFISKRIEYNKKMADSFVLFNKWSCFAYDCQCKKRICDYLFANSLLEKKEKDMIKNKEYYRFLSAKRRLIIWLGRIFPSLTKKQYINRIIKQSKQHNIV